MERVLGLGGFFFTSKDPAAVAEWYELHLGVDPVPDSYGGQAWTQQAGATVFAPMPEPIEPAQDDFFYRPGQSFALNFRVSDLDAMVQQLRDASIAVSVDEQVYPNGRFASLRDPDGNVVQLWESQEVRP
ncbi:MAG: VOC family protein [Actinobacteria bacterium]|nr:VOC family protein [Actinomycetota bacterium]